MKKEIFYLGILLLCSTWISCKKDNSDIQPPAAHQPPAGSRIKTRTGGAGVETYEYNANGNIVKISTAGKAFPDYTYDYNGNTITMKRYQADGTVSENVNIILDAKGLMIEYVNLLQPTKLFKYEYDNLSRPTKIIRYINGAVNNSTHYYYNDGNKIADSTFTGAGVFSHCREYEYYTDIISTIESENFGYGFEGKGSKNAVKKIQYKDNTGAVSGTQDFLPYELDAQFRIRKMAYQSNGAGNPTSREYTYY